MTTEMLEMVSADPTVTVAGVHALAAYGAVLARGELLPPPQSRRRDDQ